ncbi:MAG: hypothetical protein R3195_11580 [Gemmatimonadota bacterium]|nr:hypothetical protein [Gemmatimonadota bacterium]
MPNRYQVEVLELKEIHELPGAWTPTDFVRVLDHLEYDDAISIPAEEVKDMASLALSDLEPEEAAETLLELRLGERLSAGQRQNMSEEMKDERLWEEYAEMSLHEELFNVACMLYWTFPALFPEPDVTRIRLKVVAGNPDSEANLRSPTPPFIARLLNDGMGDRNTIYRLFDEQIASKRFPEAEHVIWMFASDGFDETDRSVTLTIYTSWQWVDELKGVDSFESTARGDR